MSLQTLGTAALTALMLLTVQPLSSQEGSCTRGGRTQNSSQRILRTTKGASENHTSLAVYFSELASQERSLADSYTRLAAIYKGKTPPPGTNDRTAREMAIHYKRLAETANKAAAAVETVAAHHNQVAEQVGDTPVPNSTRHATQSFSALGK